MLHDPAIGIDHEMFLRLSSEYEKCFGISLCAVDRDGQVVYGHTSGRGQLPLEDAQSRTLAVQEALRWGEPTIGYDSQRRLQWAVPLMRNEETVGGLVASATEKQVLSGTASSPPLDVRRACTKLRLLAERENLTNASALEFHRRQYLDEQQRAYIIHASKTSSANSIRQLYLKEEPALFSAIRSADRNQAREILNRILAAIHWHAGSRLDLIKSCFLELVVSMSRTAVEAGGSPEELLGTNFISMTDLFRVDSEIQLAQWLRRILEHLLDAIHRNRQSDPATLLFDAIAYMERHCCEHISRDDVARAVHLSPSHFSYLIRKESGATFTELLNRMRIDRAADLMLREDKPIALIALEAGFKDQSYFTKVFKRYRKMTPLQYRRKFSPNGRVNA